MLLSELSMDWVQEISEIKYIFFDTDLVWQMQLRLKIRVGCVGNLKFKCLLIKFGIPNLSQIYFCCLPEIFKTNSSNRLLRTNHLLNFILVL